jgi:hypothetical protein
MAWQWVFPATRFYRDPGTRQWRRHHLHETVLQRAVQHVLNRGAGGVRSPLDELGGDWRGDRICRELGAAELTYGDRPIAGHVQVTVGAMLMAVEVGRGIPGPADWLLGR